MKLSKTFKYGFLAMCLLGNAIAMDSGDDKHSYGENFSPRWTGDVSRVIVSYLPYRHWNDLALTCEAWNNVVKEYSKSSTVLFKLYEEININIHPALNTQYSGEIQVLGGTPHSLYIALPFQENTPTDQAITWNQTTGYCIDGYTGEVISLTPVDGQINYICSTSHPYGIIVQAQNAYPQLITIMGKTIQRQTLFENIEEAKDFSNPCCNDSHVLFFKDNQLSCYDLNGKSQKHQVNFPGANPMFYPFGDKFLATTSYPNSLHVINPASETLVEEQPITLPNALISDNIMLYGLTSDHDSILIKTVDFSSPGQSQAYVIINDASKPYPKTNFVSFLPEEYNPIGFYLKNNYIFSVASLMSNEANAKINEKSGVFVIYDLVTGKSCFQTFLPGIPCYSTLAGNTIFVESITASTQYPCEAPNCANEEYCPKFRRVDTKSLLSFNIKHFLS